MALTAIIDVDGTLVDSNYQHALAWHRAFRTQDISLPLWKVHRHMGMGGDQLVEALCGEEIERERGDEIRSAEKTFYFELIEEVQPLPGARELIAELKRRGHAVVLASSAKSEEVERYLDQLSVRELADDWTTSADVEATKPEPDLVRAAVEKGGNGRAVLVGDSIWDCKAAARAQVPSIGVLTGGFCAGELREAGAETVYDSVVELREELDRTPFREA